MSLPPGLIIRAGTPGDAAFIQRVHEESIRGLGPRAYSRAQVESWASGLTLEGYVRAMNQGGERFLLAEPRRAAAGLRASAPSAAIGSSGSIPIPIGRDAAWPARFWPRRSGDRRRWP